MKEKINYLFGNFFGTIINYLICRINPKQLQDFINILNLINIQNIGFIFFRDDTDGKYVSTEINKKQLVDLLGTEGTITIKNGETTTLINEDSPVNENGNVVITHNPDTSTSELVITTNKPVATGILEINHTKVITGNTYTREQLQKVTSLKAKGTTI